MADSLLRPETAVTLEPPSLLAHLGYPPTNVALCGARIMGIPAGRTYPHVCVVCKALDESRRA